MLSRIVYKETSQSFAPIFYQIINLRERESFPKIFDHRTLILSTQTPEPDGLCSNALCYCIILDNLLHHFVTKFLYLKGCNNKGTYFIGLGRFNKLTYVKCLEQYLTHSKRLENRQVFLYYHYCYYYSICYFRGLHINISVTQIRRSSLRNSSRSVVSGYPTRLIFKGQVASSLH